VLEVIAEAGWGFGIVDRLHVEPDP